MNSTKCLICLEEIENDQEYLPCAHSFHSECISKWLNDHDTCPICKIPIFITSPGHLIEHNRLEKLREEHESEERVFFQRISSGEPPTAQQRVTQGTTAILSLSQLFDSLSRGIQPIRIIHDVEIPPNDSA